MVYIPTVRSRRSGSLALGAALLGHAPVAHAQCEPAWSAVGAKGANVSIEALAVHDEDGEGPRPSALFLGSGQGKFDGVPFYLLARWDGWTASAVHDWVDIVGLGVQALMPLQEPLDALPRGLYTGADKYIDDLPINCVGRWDGNAWNSCGGGVWTDMGTFCFEIKVFDEDGQGPLPISIFAGGIFKGAGDGVPVNAIARWDGLTWSDVGGGLSEQQPNSKGSVYSLAVFDDGRGPALYAGGSFRYAGGNQAYNIARWDGINWESVGGPGGGLNATVECLAVYDEDGAGPGKPALFAGGQFDEVIGEPGKHDGLLRWDGQEWSAVGEWNSGGVTSCMTVWKSPDDESENLYIGGTFNALPDGTDIKGIARWDGHLWREVDYGVSGYGQGTQVMAMAGFDEDGDGPNPGGLYVGGVFYYAGTQNVESHFIARWGCPLGPECEADLDKSGSLDLFDFLEFVSLFNNEDPGADCDASGGLDLFDFLCFANAFNEGC